ncbi:MAG: sel1 repeat family protein [Deltaproteobacteria bacterium]|jgi:TPR repeat protein|nr:sel1 repeat family protein [Deltaproteobacteria bacterium]
MRLTTALLAGVIFLGLSLGTRPGSAAPAADQPTEGQEIKYNLPDNFNQLPEEQRVLIILTQQAEQGLVPAMLRLAQIYEQGGLVRRNYGTSLEWLKKAAAKGDPSASFSLGVAYLIGQGDAPNLTLALENIKKASDRNFPMADFQLAIFNLRGQNVAQNNAEGLRLLKKAADSGLPVAVNELGVVNYNGLWGQKEDKKAAFDLFAKAADNGFGESMVNLSICYYQGLGTPKNSVQALKWLTIARDTGHNPPGIDKNIEEIRQGLKLAEIELTEKEVQAWKDAVIARLKAQQADQETAIRAAQSEQTPPGAVQTGTQSSPAAVQPVAPKPAAPKPAARRR